jgi:hypothetical protein
VRNLSPVVLVLSSSMYHRREDLTVCGGIATKFVRYELPRYLALMFQRLTKESFSGSSVSTLGNQNINHISILVNGTPKIVALTTDRDKHFINVPNVPEPSLFPAQRSSIGRSKFETLMTNRFVGDRNAALGQQIFDITEAECESMVKPHSVTDDFRWKAVASIVGFHEPNCR